MTWPIALVDAALILLVLAMGVLRIIAHFRPEKLSVKAKSLAEWRLPFWVRTIVALACIPAGMFLVEYPYNFGMPMIEPQFIWPTLMITACIFAIVFFAAQRSRISLIVFLFGCFAMGIANYFVAQFKWQAIMPSDVASLETAEAVMGGYTFALDDIIGTSLLIVLVFACIIMLLPKCGARRAWVVVFNIVWAVFFALVANNWWINTDIAEDHEVEISPWNTLTSYRTQGFALSFLECVQELVPVAPDEYGPEKAQAILAAASNSPSHRHFDPDEAPSIVVIMNESFADLSLYSALGDSYAGPTGYKALAADSLVSGNTYVSALSGGTCNSEFEFLTGSSLGYLGTGVYPYVFYDLSNSDNIVRYLGSLGYQTTAIHPAQAHNWHRDRVYTQLGFEQFLSEEAFEGAELRRTYVTDAATYDTVLDLLASNDGPQFIFDVTITSHGGYGSGELLEVAGDNTVTALVNGEDDRELNEYLTCIAYSDQELVDFIEAVEALDKPVVVCMFGDHQPNFADELAEASFGVHTNEMGIAERQSRYTTPFLIWTNDKSLERQQGKGKVMDMSLNYLAATLLDAAKLPLDDYFSFLLRSHETLPVLNLNGYMDEEGTWRWFVETGLPATQDTREKLEILQYENLFGTGLGDAQLAVSNAGE